MDNIVVLDALGVQTTMRSKDIGGGVQRPWHGTEVVQGAANLSASHITTSTAAATLAVARPTRRSIQIRNLDAAISVYVGPATVSSTNGMLLKAGETMTLTWVGLIQVISASGAPIVAIADEYDS